MFVLDWLISNTAQQRMAVLMLVVAGGTLYFRKQQATLPRINFNANFFVEDSRNASGTRYTVITRGESTGGASAELELLVRPTAAGFFPGFPGSTPYHSHPQQEEAIKVLAGLMNYTLNGQRGVAKAGEVLLLPAGSAHSVWYGGAPDGPPLVLRVTFSPAMMGERFFENLGGLGASYGDVSQVHPLQMALLFKAGNVKIEGIPGALSWALDTLLPPVARVLGFQESYPDYASQPRVADMSREEEE